MSDNFKKMLVAIPVKIITVIVAFMIILRLGYVLYDFALNPFHPPATISKETVIHVMTSLIMLELLILFNLVSNPHDEACNRIGSSFYLFRRETFCQ